MVDFIEKGGLYDFEEDETLVTWGVAARALNWDQAMAVARELYPRKDPALYKLKIWKNTKLSDWPWCLRWVVKEDEAS